MTDLAEPIANCLVFLATLIQRVPRVHESRVKDVPKGRFGTSEEIAEVCLFLASEQCSYMNGSGLGSGRRISDSLEQYNTYTARYLLKGYSTFCCLILVSCSVSISDE